MSGSGEPKANNIVCQWGGVLQMYCDIPHCLGVEMGMCLYVYLHP
jgi:hypothetical protein